MSLASAPRAATAGRVPPDVASARAFAAAAAVVAILVGALIALAPKYGVATVLALAWVPVVLVDLPMAVALWLPLVFVAELPGASPASHGASIVILLAWLGHLRARDGATRRWLRAPGVAVLSLALLVAWLTVSLAWAEHPGVAGKTLFAWYTSLALVTVLVSSAARPRDVRVVIAGFIAGVTISALLGLVANGGGTSAMTTTVTEQAGRLQGGIGDPNFLAASIVPALALAGGLAASTRDRRARGALAGVALLLTIALAATGSRGGLVAAGVAALAGLALARRARPHLLAGLALAVAVGIMWLGTTPGALQHITGPSGGGSGRETITTIALRVYADHPVVGVGLANYPEHAAAYVLRPGTLTDVNLIVESRHDIHNAFLSVLVEAGAIGAALLAAAIAACLGAGWRARELFRRAGRPGLAGLATSVFVAALGALVAAAFLPNSSDVQLWLVLGLGPALLRVARNGSTAVPAVRRRGTWRSSS